MTNESGAKNERLGSSFEKHFSCTTACGMMERIGSGATWARLLLKDYELASIRELATNFAHQSTVGLRSNR
jgi:hypothetical protein